MNSTFMAKPGAAEVRVSSNPTRATRKKTSIHHLKKNPMALGNLAGHEPQGGERA